MRITFSSYWTASRYCWCSSTTSSRFYWPSSPEWSLTHSPSWLSARSPTALCVRFVQLSPKKCPRYPLQLRVWSPSDSRYQLEQLNPILIHPRIVWRSRWSCRQASYTHRKLFWLCETTVSNQVKLLVDFAWVDWLDAQLRITKI